MVSQFQNICSVEYIYLRGCFCEVEKFRIHQRENFLNKYL